MATKKAGIDLRAFGDQPAPKASRGEDGLLREACAWVPYTAHLDLMRVLANLTLYMTSNGDSSPRRPGDPYIYGYKVLDDGGGSMHWQIRVEGLTPAQLKRIVGKHIDTTWEHL